MSTIPAASTAFDEALFSFKQGLTDTEKLDFAQTTIDDVLKAAKEIQDKQGKRSLLRNLNRIKPYIAGLEQFSRVIEVFVQAKPEIMAFIWVFTELARMVVLKLILVVLGSDQIFTSGTSSLSIILPIHNLILYSRLLAHIPIALTSWLKHLKKLVKTFLDFNYSLEFFRPFPGCNKL